ncbi:glycosyltransferase family 2 protein [Candidatus Bathyarchaeota archaeon]|nr:glycosyltransferase family 2 protein [Candidatus Bathyarchaeota archaeon]
MFGEGHRSRVLAVVAALNEEEGIGLTIAELRQHLENPRVLVVDGHSVDRTVEVAKGLDADIVFQEGKGKGDAIATAIRHVDGDVDYVVFTDADYTYPAEYLPRMMRILDENPSVGMVCGNRFNHHLNVKAMRDAFHFGNRLIAFTHNLLNGVQLRDPLTGLRVVRSEIVRNWSPQSKGFDVEVELNHYVERQGYGICEVDISYRPRLGEKKLKLKHGATILKRIVLETTY